MKAGHFVAISDMSSKIRVFVYSIFSPNSVSPWQNFSNEESTFPFPSSSTSWPSSSACCSSSLSSFSEASGSCVSKSLFKFDLSFEFTAFLKGADFSTS